MPSLQDIFALEDQEDRTKKIRQPSRDLRDIFDFEDRLPEPPPPPKLEGPLEYAGKAVRGLARPLTDMASGAISLAGGAIEEISALPLKVADILEPELGIAKKVQQDPDIIARAGQRVKEIARERGGKAAAGAAALIGQPMSEETRRRLEETKNTVKAIGEKVGPYSERSKQSPYGAAYLFERAIVDQGPNFLAAIGLERVTPGAGIAFLSAIESGATHDQASARLQEKGVHPILANLAANREVAMVAPGTAFLEAFPLGKFGGKAQAKAAEFLGQRFSKIASSVVGEAIEEPFTGTMQDFARYLVEGDPEAWDGMLGRRAEEALLGGLSAGAARTVTTLPGAVRVATDKMHEKKASRIAEKVDALAKTPDGKQKLRDLASKPEPSRRDLQEAGLGDVRLNAQERRALARAVDPAIEDSIKHFASKLIPDVEPQVAEPVPVDPETTKRIVDERNERSKTLPESPGMASAAPPILTDEQGSVDLSSIVDPRQVSTKNGDPMSRVLSPPVASRVKSALRATRKHTIGLSTPKEAAESFKQQGFDMKSAEVEVRHRVAKLQHAMRQHVGWAPDKGVPEHLAKNVDRYIHGEPPSEPLPPKVEVAAKEMRDSLDAFIDRGTKSGAYTAETDASTFVHDPMFDSLKAKIKSEGMTREAVLESLKENKVRAGARPLLATVLLNEGLWMNRQYEAFKNKHWRDDMPKETWDDMEKLIIEQENEYHAEAAKAGVKRIKPRMTPKDRYQLMSSILDNAYKAGNMGFLLSGGKFGRQNRAIFKVRNEHLPEAYRKFLGEIDDPIANYVNSVMKVASLQSKYDMQTRLRKEGLGKFLWKENDQSRPQEAYVRLASKDDRASAPLKGLLATPEVAEALNSLVEPKQVNAAWRFYLNLESMFQKSKTVLNPITVARQLFGNRMTLVANGMQPFWVPGSPGTFKEFFTSRGTEEQLDFMKDMARFGLLGQDLNTREMYSLTNQNIIDRVVKDLVTNPGIFQSVDKTLNALHAPTTRQIRSALKAIRKSPGKFYEYADVMMKGNAFLQEMNRYKKAMPEVFTDTPDGVEALKKHAADIVRGTNQSYADLPEWANKIRILPFGRFFSFTVATYQNAVNRALLTMEEIKSPNKAVQMIGVKRALGQIAAYTGPELIAIATARLVGMTDEEKDAFEQEQPDYARYSPRWMINRVGGVIEHVNLGYADPHSPFLRPIFAILRGAKNDNILEELVWAAKEVSEPFTSPKLGIAAISGAWYNHDQWGRKIFQDNDLPVDKWKARLNYIWEASAEPGAIRAAREIAKGVRGEYSPGGKKYSVKDTVLSHLTGMRKETFDTQQTLKRRMNGFQKAVDDARSKFWKLDRQGTVSDEEIREAVRMNDGIRRVAFEQMSKSYENLRKLDPAVSAEFRDQMLGRGVDEETVDALILGKYIPELPIKIEVIERVIPHLPSDVRPMAEEKLQEQVDYRVYQSTTDPTDKSRTRIMSHRKFVSDRNMSPQEKFDRFVRESRKRAEASRVSYMQNKTGDSFSEGEYETSARNHVAKKIQDGTFWSDNDRARLKRARKLGISDRDLGIFIERMTNAR